MSETDNIRHLLSDELANEFEWIISFNIGRFYKKGWRWKHKVRWSMLKLWNDPRFNNGYIKQVREAIGEEQSLRVYQDRIDQTLNDPLLIEQALNDWRKNNSLAN